MPTNFYMLFVSALIPMVVGAVYYHPKVLGTAWMKTNGFTEESLKGANMAIIFGMAYFFSLMLSLFIPSIFIHQRNIFSLLVPEVLEVGSAFHEQFKEMMLRYGDIHRTFTHGVVHGIFTSIFFVLPLIGINALFERRGWKYTLIHWGYWAICLMLMGGLLCKTLVFALPS